MLALTDAGRTMVRDLTETGAGIEQHFQRALGPAEQAALHRMLLILLTSAAEEDQ